MADKNQDKLGRLERRKRGLRKGFYGTAERPRLSIYRSGKHIYAQVVNDHAGHTLVSVSSLNAEVRGDLKHGANVAAAKLIGKSIAEKAKAAGITLVAFDRGGRRYHGRIKALADAAREGGLQF